MGVDDGLHALELYSRQLRVRSGSRPRYGAASASPPPRMVVAQAVFSMFASNDTRLRRGFVVRAAHGASAARAAHPSRAPSFRRSPSSTSTASSPSSPPTAYFPCAALPPAPRRCPAAHTVARAEADAAAASHRLLPLRRRRPPVLPLLHIPRRPRGACRHRVHRTGAWAPLHPPRAAWARRADRAVNRSNGTSCTPRRRATG